MEKPKILVKTYLEMNLYDKGGLTEFLKKVYGDNDYYCSYTSDDSYWVSANLKPGKELNEFQMDLLNKIKETGEISNLNIVFQDLVNNGHLPSGEYLIYISW